MKVEPNSPTTITAKLNKNRAVGIRDGQKFLTKTLVDIAILVGFVLIATAANVISLR